MQTLEQAPVAPGAAGCAAGAGRPRRFQASGAGPRGRRWPPRPRVPLPRRADPPGCSVQPLAPGWRAGPRCAGGPPPVRGGSGWRVRPGGGLPEPPATPARVRAPAHSRWRRSASDRAAPLASPPPPEELRPEPRPGRGTGRDARREPDERGRSGRAAACRLPDRSRPARPAGRSVPRPPWPALPRRSRDRRPGRRRSPSAAHSSTAAAGAVFARAIRSSPSRRARVSWPRIPRAQRRIASRGPSAPLAVPVPPVPRASDRSSNSRASSEAIGVPAAAALSRSKPRSRSASSRAGPASSLDAGEPTRRSPRAASMARAPGWVDSSAAR